MNMELLKQLWKLLMINKIIVSEYIKKKDEDGFYDEMIADRKTSEVLRAQKIHDLIFANVTNTISELDQLSKLGYVEKKDCELNLMNYDYKLYYSYPSLLPMGYFHLPGNIYSVGERILLVTENYDDLEKQLHEFKRNVISGTYANILDFNFNVQNKFRSIVYEVRDKYFDSINFLEGDSTSRLHFTKPLNIPEHGLEQKRWMFLPEAAPVSLEEKERVDEAIDNLELKKDRIGLLIVNSKAYWLMTNGSMINYHDEISKEIFGIPDYLVPGFLSLENYLSRIFEDSLAQYLQSKYGYFTQVRVTPPYLEDMEIDVFANKNPKTFTVCECKFRLRDREITVEELGLFHKKSLIVKQKNTVDGNEKFYFWFVTNSSNFSKDVLEYAKSNKIEFVIAKLSSNWQRRSDWSITRLEKVQ